MTERLVAAFPPEVQGSALAVARRLPKAKFPPSETDIGPVSVDGNTVRIPSRIYHPAPHPLRPMFSSPPESLIADCLFMRHHDGHVRERALRSALPVRFPWQVPFVVQLLGEYVVEIIQVFDTKLADNDSGLYASFVRQNPKFMALTRQRVISYWDCYYRRSLNIEHWKLQTFVGMRVLERLHAWGSAG